MLQQLSTMMAGNQDSKLFLDKKKGGHGGPPLVFELLLIATLCSMRR